MSKFDKEISGASNVLRYDSRFITNLKKLAIEARDKETKTEEEVKPVTAEEISEIIEKMGDLGTVQLESPNLKDGLTKTEIVKNLEIVVRIGVLKELAKLDNIDEISPNLDEKIEYFDREGSMNSKIQLKRLQIDVLKTAKASKAKISAEALYFQEIASYASSISTLQNSKTLKYQEKAMPGIVEITLCGTRIRRTLK